MVSVDLEGIAVVGSFSSVSDPSEWLLADGLAGAGVGVEALRAGAGAAILRRLSGVR